MKKSIIAIAVIAMFTIGNGFAQRGYPSKGHGGTVVTGSRYDSRNDNLDADKLDRIVGLTRKQEKQIRKIEKAYDKMALSQRRGQSWQGQKRLEEQKQREIFSVLTSSQRQKLVAYQRADKFDNRGRFNRRG
jgi:hypothetical protein